MPFHQRNIEPRRVSRLSAKKDGWKPREEAGKRKLRKPVLFSSLDEVGCHTLTNVIHQLSDLSRHASDIFLGIEMEAGMVFRRSCRIEERLQILQDEVHKLDPKKVKIRESVLLATCFCPSYSTDLSAPITLAFYEMLTSHYRALNEIQRHAKMHAVSSYL